MYLPTEKDWSFWNYLSEKYSSLVPDSPIINTLAILIALREWEFEPRPPTRTELHRFLFERGLEGFSPWQLVLPEELITDGMGLKKKNPRQQTNTNTTEHLLLKKLEQKGLISSVTYKKFRENRNYKVSPTLNPRIQERISEQSFIGKELLYSITPMGSIFLEIIIQKPWLYHSLNKNIVKRGYTTLSLISWGYLKDKKRTPEYLNQLPEKKTILKALGFENYSLMLTPLTRIISEFHCLKDMQAEYLNKTKKFKRNELLKEQSNSSDSIYNSLESILISEYTSLIDTYLSLTLREAENYNLSIKDLTKHRP